jgi:hypothetical protein
MLDALSETVHEGTAPRTVYDRSTLCILSSGAEKQGEQNREKHTLLTMFGLKHLTLVGDTHLSGRLG